MLSASISYKLFISEEGDQSLKRFNIEKLADLENRIVGIVRVALAVGFVGKTAETRGPPIVLHSGVGVALMIGAPCLFLRFSGPAEE